MPWYDIIWNYEPGGNVAHIAEHGLTPEGVEAVICSPEETTMTHELRNRIFREATPEEKERYLTIRAEIERELPELKQWAR